MVEVLIGKVEVRGDIVWWKQQQGEKKQKRNAVSGNTLLL